VVGDASDLLDVDQAAGSAAHSVVAAREAPDRAASGPVAHPTGALVNFAAARPRPGTAAGVGRGYPGKVLRYQVTDEQHGMDFTPGGATQTEFHYVTA
jgi:hypothetical protein